MKKFLLTIFCALTAFCAMAQNGKVYTEPLVVTINGASTEPQQTAVTVYDNGDGTIDFELKNFVLAAGEEKLGVGNIFLKKLATEEGEDGLQHFSYDGPLAITAGDAEGVDMWIGPQLNEIPLKLVGKMNDNKLFVTIDITIPDQVIYVQLGTDDFPREGNIYTEPLVVTINVASTEPQQTAVTVYDNGDGTIDFELKNFVLAVGEEKLGVGNIFLKKLTPVEGEDGLQHISYDGPLAITAGDAEGVDMWIGPELGEIPLKLVGKMNDNKLFVTIDITIPNQVIYVQLGTDDFPQPQREGKVYTEPLVVTVNGLSTEPQQTAVTVYDNGDGTIDFELKNFVLAVGEEKLGVGNIFLKKLTPVEGEDGLQHISYDGPLAITAGDAEGVDMWIGPELGEIPLKLVGKMNDDKLFVTIDINIPNQVIYVQLGTDDFSTSGKVGDLNGDGKIDIADAVTVLNIMAVGEYKADADLNHDQKVDIADFVTVLNIMAAQ